MHRSLSPALLESLPPDHPEAMEFRRERVLLQELMGNFRWFRDHLPPLVRPQEGVLEIGAGAGDLGAQLAQSLRTRVVAGVDRTARPRDWPAPWLWWQTDALDFSGYDAFPVVLGNFVFHEFSPEELHGLGRVLRRSARLIVACEPARRRLHLLQAGLLGVLGFSAACRREARASIRAGFVGDELPLALGLSPREWSWRVSTGFLGHYRLIAIRHAARQWVA